jgi:anti-sigma28 factor (negative regulator of flagellin synthesis)
MRIYDVNLTGASPAEAGRSQEIQKTDRAGTGRSGGSTGGGSDRVEFSGTLGRLSQALATSGAQRAARVEALTAQYQSGNYLADSLKTSRGMIADALATGGAQP